MAAIFENDLFFSSYSYHTNFIAAPEFSVQPNMNGPIEKAEGSNVTLKCKISNDNGTQNYQWRKGTELLSPTNNDRYISEEMGQNFTINNLAVNDSGQYRCEVNISGEVVPSFKVQVIVISE